MESEGTSNTSIQLEQRALFPLSAETYALKFSLTTEDNDKVLRLFCVVKSLAS